MTNPIYESAPIYSVNPIDPRIELKGEIFLYPHAAVWIKSYDPTSQEENEDAGKMGGFLDLFQSNDPYLLAVDVWAHNESSDNWSAHGYLSEDIHKNFPFYLPASMFFGKKENDLIEFGNDQFRCILTCKQRGTRYGDGTFDQLFEEMCMITHNRLKTGVQSSTVTENQRKQWELIQKIKEEQFPHSRVTHVGSCVLQ